MVCCAAVSAGAAGAACMSVLLLAAADAGWMLQLLCALALPLGSRSDQLHRKDRIAADGRL